MTFDKIKYNNNYNKENYCRLNILIPKDTKPKMELHYKEHGYKSLNAYINELINKDMNSNHPINIENHGDNNNIVTHNGTGDINIK